MNIKIDAGGKLFLLLIKIFAWLEKKFLIVDPHTEFIGNKRKV